jgi:hypothetical protein
VLFVALQKGRDITCEWNAERRCGILAVNGQVAATIAAPPAACEVSDGSAGHLVDLEQLRAAMETLLEGLGFLDGAIKERNERPTGRRAYRGTRARRAAAPQLSSLRSQFEIYTSQCAWAGVEERQLAGLPCPLCGEPMILSTPAEMEERLVCPVCTRTQHSSAALMISLVVSRLRQTFKLAGSRLAPKARAEFGGSIELLEQLQEVLGGPSSEE